MTREEAIEVYHELLNPKIKEAFEVFAPELKESEDERMLREIKRYIKEQGDKPTGLPNGTVPVSDMITWLEKQKINTEGDFGRGYDCGYQAGYAVAANEMKPKVATTILDSEKQKEQKPVEWKPQPESLEALMYAIEGKWDMIPPTSYLSRRLEDLYEGLVNTYRVDESLVAELHKAASEEDIEALKELKRKIDASIENPVEKPTEWSEEDAHRCKDAIYFLETAKKHYADTSELDATIFWLKSIQNRGNFPKSNINSPKQEWSEEDEEHLKWLCGIIRNVRLHGELSLKEESELAKWIDKWINHEPQPKNEWSEEDERMLNVAIKSCKQTIEDYPKDKVRFKDCIDWLKSLRPQSLARQARSRLEH